MTATATVIDRPPLRFGTKLLYACGSTASAIKMRALGTFLMIFYNQVIGLPPQTVTLVLMIALTFDAIVDPLVGQISDNFKSKLGRRHPFMYAAAVPFSLAFFLLWNPPVGWSDDQLFWYLLLCLLTLRFFDTFFELPHSALAPELAKDYDERTSLISLRMLFAVIGGLGMTVAAYQFFLKENPDGSGGVLARDGYFAYSLTAAVIVFTAIIVSTMGTQSQIPYLRAAPTRKITFMAMAKEVAHTLNNRAFVVATLTGMFVAVATGARNGLEIYFGLYQEEKRWLSHELNLTSTHEGPFQWLVGAYHYWEAYEQPVSVALPNQPQFAAPANGPRNLRRFWYDTRPDFEDRSYAVFAQIDWELTDTVKMTAGLRYSHDRKFGQEEARLVCFALAACGFPPQNYGSFTPAIDITAAAVGTGRDAAGNLLPGVAAATVIDPVTGLAKRILDASWQATTGTIGFDWKPDDDTLVYAKYSKGYKAGGFNSGIVAPVVANPYTDSESNDAFEVGFKKTFFGQFQANVSAFYYDYSNFQAPVTIVPTGGGTATTQTVFLNVPKAISKGIEFEGIWSPTPNLKIIATYAFNDAYIDEATGIVDSTDPTAVDKDARPVGPPSTTIDVYTGRRQQGQDLSGNQLPQAPKNKLALNALYTWQFGAGSLTGSVSYIYRDEMYGTIFTRSYNRSPSWDQVDLRLTWTDADDRYTVIAYGKNIFDDLGYYEGSTSSRVVGLNPLTGFGVQGIATTYGLTPPRTYGVEVQYRF